MVNSSSDEAANRPRAVAEARLLKPHRLHDREPDVRHRRFRSHRDALAGLELPARAARDDRQQFLLVVRVAVPELAVDVVDAVAAQVPPPLIDAVTLLRPL